MLLEKRAKAQLEIVKCLVIKGLFNATSFNWENNYEMNDLHTCKIDQTHMETWSKMQVTGYLKQEILKRLYVVHELKLIWFCKCSLNAFIVCLWLMSMEHPLVLIFYTHVLTIIKFLVIKPGWE